MRNLEFKARCPDLHHAAEAARELGATFAGVLEQTDTYFHAPHGRLKLRELADRPAELIGYSRPDEVEFRASDYFLSSVPDPAGTKAVLESTLGLRGQVRKRRRLLLWHNVRIHLDEVEGLGTFVEFEAVISGTENEAASTARLAELSAAMSIRDEDRIAGSYMDLLKQKMEGGA